MKLKYLLALIIFNAVFMLCLPSLSAFPDQLPPTPSKHLTDVTIDAAGSLWVAAENAAVFRLKDADNAQ